MDVRVAGRTGQAYNQRKNRKGAFWQDRYHATAVQSNKHLIKCITYIDLNMVRAGVVKHPQKWIHSGYNEIQKPKQRYGLIDFKSLIRLLPIESQNELKETHRKWIDEELEKSQLVHNSKWSQSIAVGDKSFVKQIKKRLGIRFVLKVGKLSKMKMIISYVTGRSDMAQGLRIYTIGI